jgi:hypothetical protein
MKISHTRQRAIGCSRRDRSQSFPPARPPRVSSESHRELAAQETRGIQDPLAKAQAIYNLRIATMRYDNWPHSAFPFEPPRNSRTVGKPEVNCGAPGFRVTCESRKGFVTRSK